MSVKIREKKFHYRFTCDGRCYSGPCEGCRTEKAAACEQSIRDSVENVRSLRTVKALVENYRYGTDRGARGSRQGDRRRRGRRNMQIVDQPVEISVPEYEK